MTDRTPQPIATAPRVPDTSIQLYCPDQGGWHIGEWWPIDRPRWVAVIDAERELHPSHWRECPPSPVDDSERLAWIMKRQVTQQ